MGMASMAELELESGNRLLDDASYFAVVLALLDIESLIVELLALCERDFDLKVSVVAKVGLCRDEGEACILLLFLELADVLLVQQQAARADGSWLKAGPAKEHWAMWTLCRKSWALSTRA